MCKEISPQQIAYLQKEKNKKRFIFLCQWLVLFSFLLIWEGAASFGLIDSFITSKPSAVLKTLLALSREGNLYYHTLITCWETVLGFFLASVTGILCAVILWWSDFLAQVFDPYLVVLNALPKIALGPLFIVWLGSGMEAIVVITVLIALITTVLTVYTGFSQVDKNKIKLLRSFGASKWQILWKAVIPANIPNIISALKINVGLAWVGVIVGEFLVSKAGLGYLIVYGGQVFRLDLVMASVIVLSLAAGVMYYLLVWLERFICQER